MPANNPNGGTIIRLVLPVKEHSKQDLKNER